MVACKVCGGAIFASNEVVSYSGPLCNNPFHQAPTRPFNDTTSLWERVVGLETEVEKLKAALSPKQKEVKENSHE